MKKFILKQWYPSLDNDFEVGDIVFYDKERGCYAKPNNRDTSLRKREVENNPDFWELIEEKEPLFIAKDGAVFFDDFYYLVTKPYFVKTKLKAKENVYKGDGFIYFKHESNADEYIWRNKPVFSYEDFIKWANDINASFEELSQLAIERIKE